MDWIDDVTPEHAEEAASFPEAVPAAGLRLNDDVETWNFPLLLVFKKLRIHVICATLATAALILAFHFFFDHIIPFIKEHDQEIWLLSHFFDSLFKTSPVFLRSFSLLRC